MNKKRLLNILLACFSTVTVLLAGFIIFLTLTQTKAFTVQSGSMSPAFNKGDAVFVRPVNTNDLKPNDVVTIQTPDTTRSFTHRITRLDPEKSLVYTQGDANKSEDPMPADMSLIAGKVWFSVPYIGLLAGIVQNRMFLIVFAIMVTLLMGVRMLLTIPKFKKIKKVVAKMPRNRIKKIWTTAVSLIFALSIAYFAVLPPTSAWFYVNLYDQSKTFTFGDLTFDLPVDYSALQTLDLPAATKLEDPNEVTAFDEALQIETISATNDGSLPARVYLTVTGNRGTPVSLRYFLFTESDYDTDAAAVSPNENTSVMDIIRTRKNKYTGLDANIITNGYDAAAAAATYGKLEAFNNGDGVTGASDEGNYVIIPPESTRNVYIAFWVDYNVAGAMLENVADVDVHYFYDDITITLSAGQDTDGWFDRTT